MSDKSLFYYSILNNNPSIALYSMCEMLKKPKNIRSVKKLLILVIAKKIKNIFLCYEVFNTQDLDYLKSIVIYTASQDAIEPNYFNNILSIAPSLRLEYIYINDNFVKEISKLKQLLRNKCTYYIYKHYSNIYENIIFNDMFKFINFDYSLFYILPLRYAKPTIELYYTFDIKKIWRVPYYGFHNITKVENRMENKSSNINSKNRILINNENKHIAFYIAELFKIVTYKNGKINIPYKNYNTSKTNDLNSTSKTNDLNSTSKTNKNGILIPYLYNDYKTYNNKKFYKLFKIILLKKILLSSKNLKNIYYNIETEEFIILKIFYNTAKNTDNSFMSDKDLENKIKLFIKKHKNPILKLLRIWLKKINNDILLYAVLKENIKNNIHKLIININ